VDPKLLETWLRLTADAVKGTEDARKALSFLGANSQSPDLLARWMALWMPHAQEAGGGGEGKAPVQELQSLMEEWWKAIGAVPRYRYLDLLEKHHELARRLEQAEETIRRLKMLLSKKGAEKEAAGVVEAWEEITRKALEAQAEWARSWTEGLSGPKPDEKKEE
jgi:hypothetical protein